MQPGHFTRFFALAVGMCLPLCGGPHTLCASQTVPVENLTPDEITRALEAAWSHPVTPPPKDPEAVRRSALEAAISHLGPGTAILQGPLKTDEESPLNRIAQELLPGKIGYIRLGKITSKSPVQFEEALQDFFQLGARALVLDLRASQGGGTLRLAVDLASSLTPFGTELFSVRQLNNQKTEKFTSTKSPQHFLPLTVLVSPKTAGAAEVLAATLQVRANAFVLGQKTAGAAADFTQIPLNEGRLFFYPSAAAVLEKAPLLFPNGLQPDLALSIPPDTTDAVLNQAITLGKVAPSILEQGRPKLNEAALVANQNPETEFWIKEQLAAAKRHPAPKPPLKDAALQRAIDFIETRSALLPAPKPAK